jgi:hypothetical protein
MSAMIAAPVMAVSNNPWRADFRAASARRECDGERTSCVPASCIKPQKR